MSGTSFFSTIGMQAKDVAITAVQYGGSSALFGIGRPLQLATAGAISHFVQMNYLEALVQVVPLPADLKKCYSLTGRDQNVCYNNLPAESFMVGWAALTAIMVSPFIGYFVAKAIINKLGGEVNVSQYLKVTGITMISSSLLATFVSKS